MIFDDETPRKILYLVYFGTLIEIGWKLTHGKNVYTYECLHVSIPKQFHNQIEPFYSKKF